MSNRCEHCDLPMGRVFHVLRGQEHVRVCQDCLSDPELVLADHCDLWEKWAPRATGESGQAVQPSTEMLVEVLWMCKECAEGGTA